MGQGALFCGFIGGNGGVHRDGIVEKGIKSLNDGVDFVGHAYRHVILEIFANVGVVDY